MNASEPPFHNTDIPLVPRDRDRIGDIQDQLDRIEALVRATHDMVHAVTQPTRTVNIVPGRVIR